jgi:hypothetical protein
MIAREAKARLYLIQYLKTANDGYQPSDIQRCLQLQVEVAQANVALRFVNIAKPETEQLNQLIQRHMEMYQQACNEEGDAIRRYSQNQNKAKAFRELTLKPHTAN